MLIFMAQFRGPWLIIRKGNDEKVDGIQQGTAKKI